jgi:hypothetical protein
MSTHAHAYAHTPPNRSSKAADDLLAKDMTELSMQEREQVYHDVHGISHVVEETPDLVARCLADLDSELNKIDHKPYYELAKRQDPDYVSDRKLLLKFLRSESFDSQRAADRLVRFFQIKSDLFGESKLTTEIRIADLNEEDIRVLASGLAQLMPRRDRAGRTIFCWCSPLTPPNISIESRVSKKDKQEVLVVNTIDVCHLRIVLTSPHLCSALYFPLLSGAFGILHAYASFGG